MGRGERDGVNDSVREKRNEKREEVALRLKVAVQNGDFAKSA